MAVGIPNVGKRTARDLAEHFGTLESLMSASIEQYIALDDIGDIVAQSIVDFFLNEENQKTIKGLLQAGVMPSMTSQTKAGVFQGQSIVVTGTLPTLSRAQAEELIIQNGGKPASAVSKNTSFVLAGEKAGSKLKKAETLNILVLNEAEFLQKISN